MSYCRFSSMNWKCDVYVYEDVQGGWTTHVAHNKALIPPLPDLMGSRFSLSMHRWSGYKYDSESERAVYKNSFRKAVYSAWNHFVSFWHRRVHMAMLHVTPRRKIGLQYDGESFNDPTPYQCAETLCMLQALGYTVPQYAIDELKAEQPPSP